MILQKRGQIIVARASADEDSLMEIALEAGADDFVVDDEGFEILTSPGTLEAVHKALESKGITSEVAEVTALPDLKVPLNDDSTVKAVERLLEALEDQNDVQQVYSNAQFPEDQ